MNNNIYDTLKKLKVEEVGKHPHMRIYQDEKTGQTIEEPLKDMASSALINNTMKQCNQAKEIHKSIFGN